MGIGPQSINLTLTIWRDKLFDGLTSVIELGSQDLSGNPDHIIVDWLELVTNRPFLKVDSSETHVTPKDFYANLGLVEYECIDMDGRHGALKFDLNRDIVTDYGFSKRFDLVTNHGTTEHCFDQKACFKNIHDLCNVGGIMIHALPYQGYNRHGFFQYQPNFFMDLAAANSYQVIGVYLNPCSRHADVMTFSDKTWDSLPFSAHNDMTLMVILQKQKEDAFRTPYDGMYLTSCSDPEHPQRAYYANRLVTQYYWDKPDGSLTSTVDLARTLLKRIKNKIARTLGR